MLVQVAAKRTWEEILKKNGLQLSDFKEFDLDQKYELHLHAEPRLKAQMLMSPERFDYFKMQMVLYRPNWASNGPDAKWIHLTDINTRFERWITNHVLRFLNEQELQKGWSDRQTTAEFVTETSYVLNNNDRFDLAEQEALRLSLEDFKSKVATQLNLQDKQISQLNAAIQYLTQESKHQSKFNWIGIGLAVIGTLQQTLSMDWANAETLWHLFREAIRSIPKFLNY